MNLSTFVLIFSSTCNFNEVLGLLATMCMSIMCLFVLVSVPLCVSVHVMYACVSLMSHKLIISTDILLATLNLYVQAKAATATLMHICDPICKNLT